MFATNRARSDEAAFAVPLRQNLSCGVLEGKEDAARVDGHLQVEALARLCKSESQSQGKDGAIAMNTDPPIATLEWRYPRSRRSVQR